MGEMRAATGFAQTPRICAVVFEVLNSYLATKDEEFAEESVRKGWWRMELVPSRIRMGHEDQGACVWNPYSLDWNIPKYVPLPRGQRCLTRCLMVRLSR